MRINFEKKCTWGIIMQKVYFFCDSQMNILTSYFVMKIYFHNVQYQNYLFVYNNSNHSVECAKRAEQLHIWSQVHVIESAYKNLEEMKKIGEEIVFHFDDIVYIFALQNPFARLVYQKADQSGSHIRIVDEGITLFRSFLSWQKKYPEEFFADIDVLSKPLEGWCYTPKMYDLPDNVNLKKIELVQALENEEQCKRMQKEVRDIFDIKEEYIPQVIYFDQYYALEGRTTPEIEKYLLKKLTCICSQLDFALKKHPMERGFETKYSELDVSFIKSSDSPWEAVYFVNIFRKSDRKIVCITGYSTSISTPFLMYGDKNYDIVLLKKIYDRYLKPIVNIGDMFYTRIAEIGNINMFTPETYDEFQKVMSNLTGKKVSYNHKLLPYDQALLSKLCKKDILHKESILFCNLDIYHKETSIYQICKEMVIDTESFCIKYDIPEQFVSEEYHLKWRPCEYAFISLKEIEITVVDENIEKKYTMDHLVPENPVVTQNDGYMESQYYKPTYFIDIQNAKIQSIAICGKWKIDFQKDRLINRLEDTYISLIHSAEKRHDDLLAEIHIENQLKFDRMQKEFLCKYQNCVEEFDEKYRKMRQQERKNQNLIKTYEKRIEDLESSLSWRITKPFRMLVAKIKCGLK